MGLDITIERKKKIVCPKCGEVVAYHCIDAVDSSGRAWYPILEQLGYYVPWDKRTEENDWYAKDMVLTPSQITDLYLFITRHELYCGDECRSLLARAMIEPDTIIVINADW